MTWVMLLFPSQNTTTTLRQAYKVWGGLGTGHFGQWGHRAEFLAGGPESGDRPQPAQNPSLGTLTASPYKGA